MLSIKKISIGDEDYYLSLAAEDYYLEGGEPPGVWMCSGAVAFGVTGKVEPEHLRNLFRGYHPITGKPLVMNAGEPDRQAAWDFTTCVCKHLSVVWSQADADKRQRYQRYQQLAVESMLESIEKNLAFSRVGKGGSQFVRVRLVAAAYEHGTNRNGEAHLHTHTLLGNMGIDINGNTRTIDSRPIFAQKKILGAYYRAVLAHLLTKEEGHRIDRDGDSFKIVGVPDEVVDAHSTRRKEILADLAARGESGAKAAAASALRTRRTKKNVPPRSALLERWREVNESHGFTDESLRRLPTGGVGDPAKEVPRILATALANLSDQKSHFSYRDFLFEALCEAPSRAILPDPILVAARGYLESHSQVVPLHPVFGEPQFATRAVLQREKELLDLLNTLVDRPGAVVSEATVDSALASASTIRSEQEKAVRHLVLGHGSIGLVEGLAGVGKTFTLKTCRAAWSLAGYRVVGATPTGKAADVLQRETGIPTRTITKFLGDYRIPTSVKLKHHAKQFARAARRRKTYRHRRPKPTRIGPKTIVVVDEAGMANTRLMTKLLAHVERTGAKLVLVGDPAQLPAVEGGSPFLSMCNRVDAVQMWDIRRQKEQWAREAAKHFADGEPGLALAMYAQRGLITAFDTREEALRTLVRDWATRGLTTPQDSCILVGTNEEAVFANSQCQLQRLAAGCLQSHNSLPIHDNNEDKGICFTSTAHVGDRVLFTRNSDKYSVRNGHVGTVIGINVIRRSMAVELDNGIRTIVPVKQFPHIRLGYAMTTHKAQGQTVPYAYVLAGGHMQDHPMSYVQATRASRETRFYSEKTLLNEYLKDVENSALAEQMSRTPDLTLASDLLHGDETVAKARRRIIDRLLADWSHAAAGDLDKVAILTDHESQTQELNVVCKGLIEKLRSPTTESVHLASTTFVAGERIRFTMGSMAYNVRQDDLGTILSVVPSQQLLVVRLDSGVVVRIPLEHYSRIEHAYAITHRQAKGKRLKTAYVLDLGLPASDVQEHSVAVASGQAGSVASSTADSTKSSHPELMTAESDIRHRTADFAHQQQKFLEEEERQRQQLEEQKRQLRLERERWLQEQLAMIESRDNSYSSYSSTRRSEPSYPSMYSSPVSTSTYPQVYSTAISTSPYPAVYGTPISQSINWQAEQTRQYADYQYRGMAQTAWNQQHSQAVSTQSIQSQTYSTYTIKPVNSTPFC